MIDGFYLCYKIPLLAFVVMHFGSFSDLVSYNQGVTCQEFNLSYTNSIQNENKCFTSWVQILVSDLFYFVYYLKL